MPKLILQDIDPRLDGEYPLEIETFTNRELHLIKQESGLRLLELTEAFGAGDNDLLVAIAMVLLQRAGKGPSSLYKDILWDADGGRIRYDFSDVAGEDDAGPPSPEPPEKPPPDETKGSGNSSGGGSGKGGGSRANPRKRTGAQG